ncbi:MAG: hypothetical protein ACRD6I_11915 [Candidatus Acidiferrales bacterium]
MRKATQVLMIAGIALFLPTSTPAQGQSQSASQAKPKPQTQSLAEAARKARQKKQAQEKPKVYTNDNLPTSGGGVSVVGSTQARDAEAQEGQQAQTGATPPGEQPAEERGEAYWRERFAAARKQLADAEKELDILQRELNLKRMQFYNDPQKTLEEELKRTEINQHTKKIEEKQAEVTALKQAFANLEDELRQAGGNPGWARP